MQLWTKIDVVNAHSNQSQMWFNNIYDCVTFFRAGQGKILCIQEQYIYNYMCVFVYV